MRVSIDDKINELAKSGKRSTESIANFIDGYDSGWYMAVRESFRPQLDIKHTDRIVTKSMEEGKLYKSQARVWTQGPRIAFDKGHIFYDTPLGYGEWNKALKQINLVCAIIDAKPNEVKKKKADNIKGQMNELIDGFVVFEILIPNHERTKLITQDIYKMSQNKFVDFLISGNLGKAETYKK